MLLLDWIGRVVWMYYGALLYCVQLSRVRDICCRTALAEAEIEYNDSYCSPSVYVRYRLQRLSDALASLRNVIYIDTFINSLSLYIIPS